MGQAYQRVCLHDLRAKKNRTQQFALQRNFGFGHAAQTIAYDQRCADTGIGKAVLDPASQGGDRLLALTGIQGRGIGQKRLCAQLLDLLHHPSGKDRPDKGVVAFLAEMDLDGGQIILPHPLTKAAQCEQL